MLIIGITLFSLILIAIVSSFVYKAFNSSQAYQTFFNALQNDSLSQMTAFLKSLSAAEKNKLWKFSSRHVENIAQTIQSADMLEILIREKFDLNMSARHSDNTTTTETLFTWALYQTFLIPPTGFSLAGALLTHYQYDLFQLKKFEQQVKNSQLRIYVPLALRLRSYKENLIAENRVGSLLQFGTGSKA